MENKIKPKWVITPYREKDEKSEDIELQLTEFNNFQDILEFSEIYYIFGKYNGYGKLYTDFDIDPFNVTDEQKSKLGKSQNELKNNLEQNDKILRYLIVLTSIVAKIDKKKLEYIHHDEVYFIRNIIYFIRDELTNKEIVTDKFNERLDELLNYWKFRNNLEVFYIFVLELLRLFVYLEEYEIYQKINNFATVSDYLHNDSDFKTRFNNLQDQLQRNILEGKEVDAQRQLLVSVIEQSCIKFLEDVLNRDYLIFSLKLFFIKTLYFNRLIDKKSIRNELKKNKKLKIFFDKLDEELKSSEELNRKCFAILSKINQSDVKLFISGPKKDEQDFKGYIDKFINGELKIEYLQYNDYSDTDYSPYILACDKKCCMQDRDFSNFENYFKSTYNLAGLPPHFNGYNQAIYCTEKKVVSYIDKENLNGKYSLYVRFKRCSSCKLILSNKESFNYKGKVTLFVHDKGQTRGVNDEQMKSISALMYLFKDFLDNHRDREKSDKKFRSYRRICKR